MNKVLLTFVFALLSSFATAQTLPLTLDAALGYAFEHREEVRSKRKQHELARLRVDEKRGAFLPRLNLASTLQRSKTYDNFSGFTIEGEINQVPIQVAIERDIPRYQQNTSIILSYDLYDSGLSRWQLTEAEATARAAEASTREEMRNIALELAEAYTAVAKLQIEQVGAQGALDLANESEKISRASHLRGQTAYINWQSALLAREEKAAALKEVGHRLEEAWLRYARALGAPDALHADARAELATSFDVAALKSLASLGALPPQLDKLRFEAQASAARGRAGNAGEAAKVAFFAQYAFVGRDASRLTGVLGDTQRDYAAVGVKLSVDLFDAGRRPRRGQRLLENEIAQLELARQTRLSTSTHEEVVRQLRQREIRSEIAGERERLAQKKMEIEHLRWRKGHASASQYREASEARRQAADQLRVAELERALAAFKLALSPRAELPASE